MGSFIKAEEPRNLEQKILQLQKMESLGELASGITHDFNNILTSILGLAEISANNVSNNSTVKSNLKRIIIAAERGRELIEQILFFSKNGDNKLVVHNFESIIDEGLKLIRPLIPVSIKIRTRIHAGNLSVLGDKTQLYQILLNLCINASQAMKEGKGVIEITLENEKINSPQNSAFLPQPGKYLKLTVSDNGTGITAKNLNKIFEPFFTTKKSENGTGLGLSTVKSIVEAHNGMISVESREGEGASFHIYFPSTEGEVNIVNTKKKPPDGGDERILIVDDDKSITDIFKKILTHFGYSVTVSNTGCDAFDKIRSNKDSFDLIITDQKMPDISGIQLAGKIKAMNVDIPVILCSGSDGEFDLRDDHKKNIVQSIIKPVSMEELSAVVRQVLDQTR